MATTIDVIEAKIWKCTDGRTASIYGACPWTSDGEAKTWKMETVGYTLRRVDGRGRMTVGTGRVPYETEEAAEEAATKERTRLAEAAAWHRLNFPQSYA